MLDINRVKNEIFNFINEFKSLVDLEKLWIALTCREFCRYKFSVYYFGREVSKYLDALRKFIREKLGPLLGVEISSLDQDIIINNEKTSVRGLMMKMMIEYFKENKELADKLSRDVISKLPTLRDVSKKLILALSKVSKFINEGVIELVNSWIGDVIIRRMEEMFNQKFQDREVEIAIDELVLKGFVMYCNYVVRDLEKFTIDVYNQYYLPPYLIHFWRNVEEYIKP